MTLLKRLICRCGEVRLCDPKHRQSKCNFIIQQKFNCLSILFFYFPIRKTTANQRKVYLVSRFNPVSIISERDCKSLYFSIMNLFVGNLNPETTVDKLRPIFAEFGEVVSAKIIFDATTGASRGFGFVEMADKFHAFDAIDNLDATFFDGNIISVKEAKQNNTKGSSGGGRSFKPRNPRPGGGFRPRPAGGGFNSAGRTNDRFQ